MNYMDLSLEEKIGQMTILGVKGNHIDDRIKTMIDKYKVGGILIRRNNYTTYDDMINFINELKKLNSKNKVPLFIAIDQEGGRVTRLPSEFKKFPTSYKLASLNDVNFAAHSTDLMAKLLNKCGVNLNFAPVLDIKRFDDSHALGDRCYADNKEDVAKFGIAVMKEFQKNNVLPVIKHFPGHGTTTTDSHFFLPVIHSSMKDLEKEDLFPFLQAFKNGADSVLISHLLIKGETGIYPASLSKKFIHTYLRDKYNFKGLIVTDDLKMFSIKLLYGPVRAVKKAFQAGNDIIMFRYDSLTEKRAFNAVYSLAKSGKLKESQINESVDRILKFKEKYNVSDEVLATKVDVDLANKEIDEIRKSVGI